MFNNLQQILNHFHYDFSVLWVHYSYYSVLTINIFREMLGQNQLTIADRDLPAVKKII